MVITSLAYLVALYYLVLKKYVIIPLYKKGIKPCMKTSPIPKKLATKIVWLIIIASAVAFVVYDSIDEPLRIASGGGLLGFVFLGFIFSVNNNNKMTEISNN